MRRLMLGVAMVMICSYNHAQEYENPFEVNSIKETVPLLWFVLKSDQTKLIYGRKFEINALAYNWFNVYGIDITKPDLQKKVKGRDVCYWFTENELGENIEIAFFDYENSRELKIKVIE